MSRLFSVGVVILLTACAAIEQLEPPKVEIFGFEAVAHEHGHVHSHGHGHSDDHSHGHHDHHEALPGFRIGVFVRNPNDININPKTMEYRITLENDVVLSGRMTDLQRIEGLVRKQYDFVFVPSDPGQIAALHELLQRGHDEYEYELLVRVSFSGYASDYTARDSGEIDLDDYH